jgi:hypothetical protein
MTLSAGGAQFTPNRLVSKATVALRSQNTSE